MGKKILVSIVSAIMLMATSVTAFAAEPQTATTEPKAKTEMTSLNEENAITPRSSISGYGHGTVSPSSKSLIVYTDSYMVGGAGATIKLSAGSTYNVTAVISEVDGIFGGYREMGRQQISTNGTFYFNNMWHNAPTQIMVTFEGLQGAANAEVWIYG